MNPGTGLWDCLEAALRSRPDKLAMDDGRSRLSYGECLGRIMQISFRLQALQLSGDRISVLLLDTGMDSAVAMLAHVRAGIVFVPVDTALSANRIRTVIESCLPAVVVTDSRHLDVVPKQSDCHLMLVDQAEGADTVTECPPAAEGEEVCRVLTSGSTGVPRQVIYTPRMILHDVLVRTESLRIAPSDRFCQWIGGTSLPLMTVFLSVMNGASLHIRDIHRLGMEGLPGWIRVNEVTILRLTPTLLRLLLQQNLRGQDLSSVRLVSTGGETLTPADVERFTRVFPPDAVLLNHLSATEYRVACQYFVDTDRRITDSRIPVGFPVKDVEIDILDDDGDSLPHGEIGEIAIRSEFISPGFIETGSGERREYDLTPRGFYLTGDLGSSRADQCIVHHGRKDRMAKIRGMRVELDEVESVLSRLDGVMKAAALMAASRGRGPLLAACIVEKPGSVVSLKDLRRALHAEMGLFGLPHRLEKRDSLPVTPNGKIDYIELHREAKTAFE